MAAKDVKTAEPLPSPVPPPMVASSPFPAPKLGSKENIAVRDSAYATIICGLQPEYQDLSVDTLDLGHRFTRINELMVALDKANDDETYGRLQQEYRWLREGLERFKGATFEEVVSQYHHLRKALVKHEAIKKLTTS